MKSEVITIKEDKKGRLYINLPEWALLGLYKASKIKSKKKRHIKKAIQKAFIKALEEHVTD